MIVLSTDLIFSIEISLNFNRCYEKVEIIFFLFFFHFFWYFLQEGKSSRKDVRNTQVTFLNQCNNELSSVLKFKVFENDARFYYNWSTSPHLCYFVRRKRIPPTVNTNARMKSIQAMCNIYARAFIIQKHPAVKIFHSSLLLRATHAFNLRIINIEFS